MAIEGERDEDDERTSVATVASKRWRWLDGWGEEREEEEMDSARVRVCGWVCCASSARAKAIGLVLGKSAAGLRARPTQEWLR